MKNLRLKIDNIFTDVYSSLEDFWCKDYPLLCFYIFTVLANLSLGILLLLDIIPHGLFYNMIIPFILIISTAVYFGIFLGEILKIKDLVPVRVVKSSFFILFNVTFIILFKLNLMPNYMLTIPFFVIAGIYIVYTFRHIDNIHAELEIKGFHEEYLKEYFKDIPISDDDNWGKEQIS